MISQNLSAQCGKYPKLFLTCLFLSWKAILFLVTVTSPSPGYDTSTTLLDWQHTINDELNSPVWSRMQDQVPKLVRWDAIYFTQIARRGVLFEQEWAFGWGFNKWIRIVGSGRPSNSIN